MLSFLSSLLPLPGRGTDIPDIIALKVFGGVVAFLSSMMPERSAKKIVAIVLLLLGVPVKSTVRYSGLKKSALYNLRAELRNLTQGADFTGFVRRQCTVMEGRGRKSPIRDIEDEIIAHIESTNCFTLAEIRQWIADEHGIKVSARHLSGFLKGKGIRKLKGGSIPAKADPEKQKEFYSGTLLPLMEKAGKGDHILYFVDAAHFVLGNDFIGSVYCRVRRFARTRSGRSRYNVLGALDFVTKKVITVTNSDYINADSVCALLKKVRAANEGKTIYFVLDNARYQKCTLVQELAGTLRINLVYLPSYSPNLNLIERLWRFVKTELRRSAWDDFKAFSSKIDTIIDSTTKENAHKISSLIGQRVQLYYGYVNLDDYTLSPPSASKEGAA